MTLSNLKIAIFADDLTGSADSAVQFAKSNLSTAVAVDTPDLTSSADLEVLVFDTESRDIPKDLAATRVFSQVRALTELAPQALIYKKVDSTLRGNIGAELQAALEAAGASAIIFSPAFVPSGRTTLNGVQYLNGVRLEETELSRVPKSPVKKSLITEIIAEQSKLACQNLGLEQLRGDPQQLKAHLAGLIQQGIRIIIADATESADQDRLVAATQDMPGLIYAGSAGLAAALSKCYAAKTASQKTFSTCQHVLVLAGSISAVTREQVRHLCAHEQDLLLLRSDPRLTVQDPKQEALRIASKLKSSLQHKVILISVAYEEADVAASAAAGQELGLSFFEVGERTATLIAELTRLCHALFDGFIITGGDTAIHACQAVQASLLNVLYEVQSGIPLTRIATGPLAGKFLVTKAGAFGKEDAFTEAVALLTLGQHQ
ncbi:MAG: hypothetical protein K6F05_00335 [Succinivibrio sp.]|nr:hypothetical protein [Succinivibrio sp.]